MSSRKPNIETDKLYAAALQLYRTTDLSVKEICERTNTRIAGFKGYIYRYHRELMLARHGVNVAEGEGKDLKLRKNKGQTSAARAKYHDAIAACDDAEYIEYNISQIAAIFNVDRGGLAQQLRSHFPEIMERREKERQRLGVNDNFHRGTRQWCKKQYADAIDHLRNSDDTIIETAERFKLSATGLRAHLLYYHKELVEKREGRRKNAKGVKKPGSLTGNGQKHVPGKELVKRYEGATDLYRSTAMTMREIAETTGVTLEGFRNYVRVWHADLMLERRGVSGETDNVEEVLKNSKQYLKSTAAKYADAITRLKKSGLSTAEIAKEYDLNADCFREYLYEHEPELAAQLGMTRLPNGKLVLARSAEKYEEAIEVYKNTTESLRSIAKRLGIQYNSLGGFIRRNYPDVIECHNLLVKEKSQRQKEQSMERAKLNDGARKEEEKRKIIEALKQTGGNKSHAAKLLGISKSALYNKLNLYKLR